MTAPCHVAKLATGPYFRQGVFTRPRPKPALASLHFIGSFHQSDVARLPTLVDCTFGRAVKPENDEIRLSRHGREPVALFAFRCFRTKVKVGASIGVLRRLIARTKRR